MNRSVFSLTFIWAILVVTTLSKAQSGQAAELNKFASGVPHIHLPVELVSFTANLQVDEAIINWEIANEVNIEFYEVEVAKSNTEFAPVGRVSSIDRTGNGAKASYNFSYKIPTGAKYLFRLKMVDMNGNFLTSYIRTVNAQTKDLVNIRVWPNPATDHISITGMREGANVITVCDATGTRLMTFNTSETEAFLNFANFLPGIYNVIVQDGNGLATSRRLMKQ